MKKFQQNFNVVFVVLYDVISLIISTNVSYANL